MDAPTLPLLFLDSAWRIFLVLIGVGGVIFFHEMGHFLVARFCGVRTEAFSLAFPPNLLVGRREARGVRVKWIGCKGDGVLLPFWKSERDPTEYRVGLIPLGGYVKMAGEGIGEGTGEPDELRSKSVAARGAIFSAGVVMNVIFAFLAFTIAFQIGVPLESPIVGGVAPGSPAAQSDLKVGDRVRSIDGAPVAVFGDIIAAIAHADGPVTLTVERDGAVVTLRPMTPVYDPDRGLQVIGLAVAGTTTLDAVAEPAASHGLRRGDRIVHVAGTPVRWQWEYIDAFRAAATGYPEAVTFGVERDRGDEAPERFEVAIPTREASAFMLGIGHQVGLQVRSMPGDSPLARAGLAAGDFVTTIGDAKILEDGFEAALASADGEVVPCVLVRAGEFTTLQLPTTPELWQALESAPASRIADVHPKGAADGAGLTVGTLVFRVGGTPITKGDVLAGAVKGSRGEPLTLVVVAPGETVEREIRVRPWLSDPAQLGLARVRAHKETTRLGLGGALAKGWDETIKFAEQVLLMFRSLAKRKVSADNLGGPVTIVNMAYLFTEGGIGATLFFLGILSVNLAILNVLPIPVLDGGHLFFLLIEAVRRRPVSENVQVMAQYVGLLLLLALMVFVTVNDIGRLF